MEAKLDFRLQQMPQESCAFLAIWVSASIVCIVEIQRVRYMRWLSFSTSHHPSDFLGGGESRVFGASDGLRIAELCCAFLGAGPATN
ncbi:hypothetical protein B4W69_12450 [Staphylococcus delphini]|nr:hypothetical protein B4W69_12450 [Staphylococcus delphini]